MRLVVDSKTLEEKITEAKKKIGCNTNNELCRYIPGDTYKDHMHHFSFKKLINKNPKKACELLEEYILNTKNIKQFPPKQRSSRALKSSIKNTLEINIIPLLISAINKDNVNNFPSEYKQKLIHEIKNQFISNLKSDKEINADLVKVYNTLLVN